MKSIALNMFFFALYKRPLPNSPSFRIKSNCFGTARHSSLLITTENYYHRETIQIIFRGDSKLVTKLLEGQWTPTNPKYQAQIGWAQNLFKKWLWEMGVQPPSTWGGMAVEDGGGGGVTAL